MPWGVATIDLKTPECGHHTLFLSQYLQTLILDSRVLCDQQLNERTQQRFASLSHIVNKLEEPQVEREFLL